MHEIWMMAKFEWKAIRSKRGLLIYTIFFAGFCIAISYFGSLYSGIGQMQGLKSTAISLLNFSLLFVPLMALISGVTSFTDNRESWELVVTQPIRISELLLGKFLGQFFGLAIPILIGFGGSAGMIVILGTLDGWREFIYLLTLNLLTAAIFLSISFFLVTICKRKSKVYGWTFTVWTVMVLFYDMLVIGITILSNGANQKLALWAVLLLNPADMVRILGISQMGTYDSISATGTLVQKMMLNNGSVLLSFILLFWLIAYLLTAVVLAKRQDLV